MKSFTRIALSILVISVLLSCGSSDSNNNNQDTTAQQTPSATVAATPLPADIEKKFGKIINEYQKKISTGFSGTFQADTRHGGKGPEEAVFDADKFDAYMIKKGFSKIPTLCLIIVAK